jgi:hypothetical protein
MPPCTIPDGEHIGYIQSMLAAKLPDIPSFVAIA